MSQLLTTTQASRGGASPKRLYFFEEGSGEMRDLLGGKGAGLADMTRAGFPVPPGFIVTTEACLEFYRLDRRMPEGLEAEIESAIVELEGRTRKVFGGEREPLLVSVRSGARVSMPGMMDTILNLGLNDKTVIGLATASGDERFALDAYRRFIGMFADIVLRVDRSVFDRIIEEAKAALGVTSDPQIDAATWKRVIATFKANVRQRTGRDFPQDVYEQLRLAIFAVFDSWNSQRAIDYRRFNKIPDDFGTAVSVVSMVFGNLGDDSGTGVAFTRDPNTGERKLFGEYLRNAQGEDVVAGIRTPEPISDLKEIAPAVYGQFIDIADKLERHYRDMQDLEFTVERGKLYMLQTRSAKRSAEAAVRVALDMVHEGLIDRSEALRRVDAASLDQLFHARIDPRQDVVVAAKGLNASPGAASGFVVFEPEDAVTWAAEGKPTILVRGETTPDDVHGMIAARGVLTARGGATSHAAVVARGMGKPCVTACAALVMDERARTATLGGHPLKQGDEITIDGTTGKVALGILKLIDPPSELPAWLGEFLSWADDAKRLGVWANADTPQDARKARDRCHRYRALPHRAHVHGALATARHAAHDFGKHTRSAHRGARRSAGVPARRL